MIGDEKLKLIEESKYRQLIDQMPTGYAFHKIICNDKGKPIDFCFLEVNPAFELITGLKARDIISHTCLEVFPQIEPRWIERYGNVALTGTSIIFEDFFQEIDRYLEVTAFCTSPHYFACMFHDITKRTKSENALIENEKRYKKAQKMGSVGNWEYNLKTSQFWASEETKKIFGFEQNTIKFTTEEVESCIPERERVHQTLINLIEKDHDYNIEYDIITKNTGQIKTIQSIAELEKNTEGYAVKVSGVITDITLLKEKTAALHESEAKFREMAELLPQIIFELDTRGNLTYLNKLAYTILGYINEESFIGKSALDFFTPTDKERALRNIKRSLACDKHEINNEYTMLRKNGSVFNVLLYSSAIIKNNQPIGLRGVIVDISEMKEIEKALVESEKRLKIILDTSPFPIAVLDENDEKIKYWSQSALKLFGHNPKTSQEWHKLAYPDPHYRQEVIDRWKPFLKKAQHSLTAVNTGEYRIVCKDGSVKICGIFARFVLGNLIITLNDITKRKEAERKIAAEKELLAVTLRSIGDGVITTDINGKIVMLNKVAEELTGWHSTEAIGHPLSDVFNIINEITRKRDHNPVDKVIETGGIIEQKNHTSLIAKDGQEIIIADTAAPIHDSNSIIIGVVLVFRDMTEKQVFDEMRQKTQKLESLGILAGGIAHDFNNILSGVFGYIEMARLKTTEIKVLDYLAKSSESIDRASALTQQLLTFAKGGVPIKKVGTLFPFIQKTAQFALSGSSVSSEFQIQKNLSLCNFDKNQIGQVVDNLTINAQQAMPTGGTIQFLAQNIILSEHQHISLPSGHYIKLSIKDSGIGIPKEFLKSIFDPYFTTKSEGHGLGLATCYSIISRHGGSLEVESELGKGTTFHIYLPASIETAPPNIEHLPQEHQGTGTFLVMDDEEMIRYITKEMLESFGYNVILKENGKDTLEFFKAEINANRKIAGMIFDLTIPGSMGGEEAIGEIRKLCSDTPVFVASGYSVNPIMADPIKYGFTASISKPFRIAELSKMLEKHMK